MERTLNAPNVLALALAVGIAGCQGVIGDADPPLGATPGPGSGLAGEGRLPARLWRLTPAQFEAEAERVFGDLPDAGRYPEGPTQHGFSNAATASFDLDGVGRLAAIAEDYADHVAANAGSITGCTDSSCIDAFIRYATESAYRRAVTDPERAALRTLYDSVAVEHGDTYALRTLVQAILMSPNMIYRTGLGAPYDGPTTGEPAEGESIVVLSGFEIANLLSFALTDESPDAELLADAERLRDPEVRADHARRLMARSHGVWRRFFWEWLDMSRFQAQVGALSIPASLSDAMRLEYDEFVGRVVVDGRGTLRDVLTSSRSYATPELAEFYGVAHSGEGVQPIEFDPSQRAGILSQGAWLVSHGSREEEYVVRRGMGLYLRAFCNELSTPAELDVLAEQGRLTPPDATVREKTDARSSSTTCARCHQTADPIGLAFETFDAWGRHREMYPDGDPIDSVATVPGMGEVSSASELGAGLAEDAQVRACFVRRVAQTMLGADLGWRSSWLMSAEDEWLADDGRIESLVVALVRHPGFVERSKGAE